MAEHTDAMARTTRRTYYDDGLPALSARSWSVSTTKAAPEDE
ncbi:hypothetical protein [Streptomyces tunisiensis]